MSLTKTLACMAAVAVTGAAMAQSPIRTTRIVTGLSYPTFVTAPAGDTSRLFVLEKRGVIKIIDLNTNTVLPTPFLNIDPIVQGGSSVNDEQGLLGLAFDPDYANNGYFYVDYTGNLGGGDTYVARYKVSDTDPNVADATSALVLMTWNQPFSNHNGGWIGFGPDGYLYIATGDGGSANDPGGRAQDITDQPLGKMLRIDVSNSAPGSLYEVPADNPFVGAVGDDEIWAYGLRNPWRPSFDRATGDLWIADVGQGLIEEINFQPAGAPGGRNYGWRCMEGNNCTGLSGCTCNSPALTDPIHTYGHNAAGGISITGGYVYRGCQIPEFEGNYIFADWGNGKVWTLQYDGNSVSNLTLQTSNISPSIEGVLVNQIASFGEDANGELYVVDHGSTTTGQVFRIIRNPALEPLPDCNDNGNPDSCDIANGASMDENGNGIPDECESNPADLDGDGLVNGADLGLLLGAWGKCLPPCAADLNGDGTVDGADLGELLAAWSPR
ncbi:MAG: PQQ-dependent sugar dehydrogenase [Phycisphaerales bacterium]|nr:PQQ-dependent sugar dehydrogenase [Phycisphaerales bacterium]